MKSIATAPVMCLAIVIVATTTPPSSPSASWLVVAAGAVASSSLAEAAVTGTTPPSRTVASSSSTTTSTSTRTPPSTTTSTTDYYESVRQLDRYGNSIQLRHAAQAAQQHGRLVVAVSIPHQDCVLLCTPVPYPAVDPTEKDPSRKQPNEEKDDDDDDDSSATSTTTLLQRTSKSPSSSLHFTSRGIQRRRVVSTMTSKDRMRPSRSTASSSPSLACIVSNYHDPSGGGAPTPTVAIVTSGLAADARFVHQHVWEASKLAFDKYNAALQGPAVLHELQALYRNFWGYPTSTESWDWRSRGGGNNGDNDNDDGASDWARPLGVTTLVVQMSSDDATSSSKDPPPAQLYVMEPSGIVKHAPRIPLISDIGGSSLATLACIGKDSAEVQKRLEKLLRDRRSSSTASTPTELLTLDEAIRLVVDAIRGRSSRHDSSNDWDDAEDLVSSSPTTSLYVEIHSANGEVKRKIVPM